jgi:hypothetical protein
MDRSLQADDQDKQRSVYNFAPRTAMKLVRGDRGFARVRFYQGLQG